MSFMAAGNSCESQLGLGSAKLIGGNPQKHGQMTEATFWSRFVELWVRFVVFVCRIDAELAPRTERVVEKSVLPDGLKKMLPAPIVRRWTSPLPSRGANCMCHTYDQPGRWMSDTELHALHEQLIAVAERSMDDVPTHRLLQKDRVREALANRIVSVAVDTVTGEAVGFTAMVCLQSLNDVIVHLGLTMISREYRGRRIQSPLFTRCLCAPMFNWFTLSYMVTSIAASPAGIGACSDYFCDVFPNYRNPDAKPVPWQLFVARDVLRHQRHEFACSWEANFSEETFVVEGSNDAVGGGAPEFIKTDGQFVSRHKSEACNAYCSKVLDIARGDELFQVGRVDIMLTTLKYMMSGSARDTRTKKKH